MKKDLTQKSLKQSILFGLLLVLTTHTWAVCEQEEKARIQATLEFLATECSEYPSNYRCKDSQSERLRKINDQIKIDLYDSSIGWAPATERQKLNDADRKSIASTARFQYIRSREVYDRSRNKHFTAMYLHHICLREAAPQPHPSTQNRNSTSINNQVISPTVVSNDANSQSSNATQQQLQAAVTQSQTRAREAQQRGDADAQRRGRRMHDPAAEAHECISVQPPGAGLFGGLKNSCSYQVGLLTCNQNPRRVQGGFNWSADFDCAQQQFGLHTIAPNSSVAAHTNNTEFVHWFACKAPAGATDVTFDGSQVVGRCR